MARKKKHEEHANHERWLVSYADFITLLFAFFVVMFASSQTDKARAVQVSDSIAKALEKGGVTAQVREVLGGTVDEKGKGNAQLKGPGGVQKVDKDHPPAPPPMATDQTAVELTPGYRYLTKELEADIAAGKIEVRMESRGLVVSLHQATFFPSGEDSVDPKTFSMVQKIADTIKKLPSPVRLEGHTDSIPIHTARFPSNWELSAARAIAMMNLLADRYNIDRKRLAIAGYADTMPVDSNETESGRTHNRRVDVVILNQQAVRKEPVAAAPGAATPGEPPANAPPPETGAKRKLAVPVAAPAGK
jgi:chemotaxis protein MotB